VTQVFYSLGIAFGGLLTFASYNKFDNNLNRLDKIHSCFYCCLPSLRAVFAGKLKDFNVKAECEAFGISLIWFRSTQHRTRIATLARH